MSMTHQVVLLGAPFDRHGEGDGALSVLKLIFKDNFALRKALSGLVK